MRLARSVVPLAVLAATLWVASPIDAFDRGPASTAPTAPKTPPKPPPPANNTDAQDRIAKKESRMKQRDKEMDKRMKQR